MNNKEMEGERVDSNDGCDDVMSFEKPAFLAKDGEYSLLGMIDKNYENLAQALKFIRPAENYIGFKRRLASRIDAEQFTSESLWQAWIRYMADTSPASSLFPIYCSTALSMLAEEALENGKHGKAWSFTAQARYYAGLADIFNAEKSLELQGHRKSFSQLGGQGRSRKLSETDIAIRDETIRLLHEKKPDGGWGRFISKAIEKIAPSMEEFYDKTFSDNEIGDSPEEQGKKKPNRNKKKTPLSKGGIETKLRRLISTDPLVHAAYLATKN